MMDMTLYGRQETWEDSSDGWPQRFFNTTSAQMCTKKMALLSIGLMVAQYRSDPVSLLDKMMILVLPNYKYNELKLLVFDTL